MSVGSDAFVFVHLQKCGGTHISRILTTHFGASPLPTAEVAAEAAAAAADTPSRTPKKLAAASTADPDRDCVVCGERQALFGWDDHRPLWCQTCKVTDALVVGRPKHSPFRRHQDDARPVIGAIRNPYSLYVSLFAYGVTGQGRMRKDIAAALGDVARDRLYSDAMDVDAFREWLPLAVGNPVMGLVTRRFADLYVVGASPALALAMENNRYAALDSKTENSKNQDVPALSAVDKSVTSTTAAEVKENAVGFVRQECLEESLLELLQTFCGVKVQPETRREIMCMGKTWTSAHRPYEHYYDEASRRLVATADRWVLDRFGYRFGM